MKHFGAKSGKGGFRPAKRLTKADNVRINTCYEKEVDFYTDNEFTLEQLEAMVDEERNCVLASVMTNDGPKVTAEKLTGTKLKAWQDSITYKRYEEMAAKAEEDKLKAEAIAQEVEEKAKNEGNNAEGNTAE